jgi:ribosomal protein S18 acetylase RimI-like enzyme
LKREISIRQAVDSDLENFIEFSLKLARYNRSKHSEACKYDDFEQVLCAVKAKAENLFKNRGNGIMILIAELDHKPVGYALGRIVHEEKTADNGTGKTGLFDELFVDEVARGFKLGQQLTDGIMTWMNANGLTRVKLHAWSWNTTAIALYERNGFIKYASSFEKYI